MITDDNNEKFAGLISEFRRALATELLDMANEMERIYSVALFKKPNVEDYGKVEAGTFISRCSAAMGRHIAEGWLRERAKKLLEGLDDL